MPTKHWLVGPTLLALALAVLSVAGATCSQVMGQSTPTVATPQSLPLPTNAVTQGLVWTPAQWNTAFSQKKDVLVFTVTTSGSAAVRLTTNGAVPAATNVGTIPTSMAVQYSGQCIVLNQTTKAANTYTVAASAISNIAGTVAVSGTNPAVVAGPQLNGGLVLAAAITIIADNTFKGWQIGYTPPVANVAPIIAKCTIELLAAS